MEKVSYIDLLGVYAIKEAVSMLQDNNITLLVTGLQQQPRDMLNKVRMIPHILPKNTLHLDFQSAIKSLSTVAPYFSSQKMKFHLKYKESEFNTAYLRI